MEGLLTGNPGGVWFAVVLVLLAIVLVMQHEILTRIGKLEQGQQPTPTIEESPTTAHEEQATTAN